MTRIIVKDYCGNPIFNIDGIEIGVEKIGNNAGNLYLRKKPSAETVEWIKANKAEIVEFIKNTENAFRQEKEDEKAATVEFYTGGWESHKVSVDTRKDLDEQFAQIASRYPNDCTAESVKEDYKKQIGEIVETEFKKAEKESAEAENEAKAFSEAKLTGEKQIIKKYVAECNDPKEECDQDIVIIYAMPDGMKKTERNHTW